MKNSEYISLLSPSLPHLSISLPPYRSANPIRLSSLRESHSEDTAAHLIWAQINNGMSCEGMQRLNVFLYQHNVSFRASICTKTAALKTNGIFNIPRVSIMLGYYSKLHLKYLHCCFKLWWRHQNPFTWMNPPSNYKVLTEVDFTVRYLATDGICCPPHAGQLKLILWRCIGALVGNAGGRQSGTSGGPPSSRVHFQTDGCQPEECGDGEEVPGEPVKIPPPTETYTHYVRHWHRKVRGRSTWTQRLAHTAISNFHPVNISRAHTHTHSLCTSILPVPCNYSASRRTSRHSDLRVRSNQTV